MGKASVLEFFWMQDAGCKRKVTSYQRKETRDKQAGGYGIKENFRVEGNTQEGDRDRHVGCGLDGLSRPTSQFFIQLFVFNHCTGPQWSPFSFIIFPLSFFL